MSLWYVVQRTKLCLDFTCTLYLIHVLVCWRWNGHLAATLSWWFFNLVCVTLTCVASGTNYTLYKQMKHPGLVTNFFLLTFQNQGLV